MKRNSFTIVIVTAAAVLLGGCSQQADAPQTGPKAERPGPRKQAPEEPADTSTMVAPTLSVYEDIRAELAADDIERATEQADALAKAATKAAAKAPGALRSRLANTAKAAEALAGTPTDDADAVRRAFGEVSRSVVALIAADPSFQDGLHLFECPMAQGYKKWVQRTDSISNPYMGGQMLECGSEMKWAS